MSSLITRISSNLQLKDDYISSIIRRSNYYYKDYYIPKSNGGRRKISQASPELKTLQYWVKTNILSLLPISKAAFAYNRGNSIKNTLHFIKSLTLFSYRHKSFFSQHNLRTPGRRACCKSRHNRSSKSMG